MAEPEHDGLFREIDEELRQEHYAKLWKRYGKFIIAAAVALVAVVAGYQGWRAYDIDTRETASARFEAALRVAATDAEGAGLEFAAMAEDGSGGYALMARFQQAGLLARSGDWAGAIATYERIATDADDPLFRDLAVLLGVIHEINAPMAGLDAAALEARLAPLTEDENPWRYSARELTALLALRDGDADRARTVFDGIAKDPLAPAAMRSRAAELLSATDSG